MFKKPAELSVTASELDALSENNPDEYDRIMKIRNDYANTQHTKKLVTIAAVTSAIWVAIGVGIGAAVSGNDNEEATED